MVGPSPRMMKFSVDKVIRLLKKQVPHHAWVYQNHEIKCERCQALEFFWQAPCLTTTESKK